MISTLALGGCDFFKELESVETGTETGDETASESGDETAAESSSDTEAQACSIIEDECVDQDTLMSCDFESGELNELNCAALCAPNINVTCMMTPSTVHACWCAAPGTQKLDSCSQLEDCLNTCGPDATGECGFACMERTDANTVRLLGALLSCADIACDDICKEDLNVCANCILSARAGLSGNCSLERSICDQDTNDDPWNP